MNNPQLIQAQPASDELIANDNAAFKNTFKNLAREAKMVRGEIIDTSCKIEAAISTILSTLHKHSQYHKILKTAQPQLGALILVLQNAIKVEHILKAKLKNFEPLLPALNEALETRNSMAHSEIKIAALEDLQFFLLLSRNEFEKGVPSIVVKTTSLNDIKKKSQKLIAIYGKIEKLKQDW